SFLIPMVGYDTVVPLIYKQLGEFVMSLDFLKQVASTSGYRSQCIKRDTEDKIIGRKRHSVEQDQLDKILNPSCPNKKNVKVALRFRLFPCTVRRLSSSQSYV
ncbi:hypothetical protein DFQ30_000465, partial [Apophysomyces sp. BC1015]